MEEKKPPLYFRIIFGLIFLGAGIAIILMAGDVIPTDESDINAPRWIGALGGGLFAAAGVLILNDDHIKWLSAIMMFFLISAFGLIFGWIALYGAAEGFSLNERGGLNRIGVFVARFMFGSGALICALLVVGTIIDQVGKLIKK